MPVLPTARPRLLIQLPPFRFDTAGLPAGFEADTPETPGRPAWAAGVSRGPCGHPWDAAHLALADPAAVGLEADPPYAEPHLVQRFEYRDAEGRLEAGGCLGPCERRGPIESWPWPDVAFAWHLGDDSSGLKAARGRVGDPAGRRVCVAHLDTGYDPDHVTLPAYLDRLRRRNMADGDADDATDPGRHHPPGQPRPGLSHL